MLGRLVGTKKKDSSKSTVSQFLRSTDDEIKAELEAMTNLEYNLHSDFQSNDHAPDPPLFSVRKTRNVVPKESFRHEKLSASATEKSSSRIDKIEVENQIQTYVPNASVEELQMLIRQAAATSEDKYRILDARDRLMRMKQVKSQLLSMTKVTRGTCPDMCPEKERMMRESQRQVAAYELLEGEDYRINHQTAVKQYSRSSADQEEPMPQDLRPVESLKMTMSYLLHEIADLCEENGTNLAEWYHFLWDRTRGIRKDITQQELCCHDSVDLVEQCARFHIVCAEHLCAEEVSVFDKKINTENLTKCLQTLKYMYHDLRVKGLVCKNEPEFRAYIILLNLNNGNFMWDVQRLPSSIQKSPEIRFAIEIYSSIESNNYAKFFRLVRKTTYLNSCILLRYFNQVRVTALSIMVKAYCRTNSNAFPLYELIDILGFEGEDETVYFCEQVGLNLSNDDLHIMLNRQNFSQPMSNIEQGRACNIVASKRIKANLTIGQCIAGETIPEKLYKNHVPHDSFDSQGYLKPESITAEDQNVGKSGKQNDPYEYMDEDVSETPEILRPREGTRKQSTDRKKSEGSHGFKIPSVTSRQSNVFQNSAIISKQRTSQNITKKSEDFSGVSAIPKSLKRGNESVNSLADANSAAKSPELDRPTAPVKRSREEDVSPFGNAQGKSSIFGNANRGASVFGKSTLDGAKLFADRGEAKSTMPAGGNIFGKRNQGNIFDKVTSTTSIFSSTSHSNEIPSKSSEESWSRGNASNFQRNDISRGETDERDGKSGASSRARECQETEKRQEMKRRELLEVERQKMLRRVNRESEGIFEELQKEIIHDVCSTIVKEEIERMKLYNMLSDKIVNEILDEFVQDNCEDILNREIDVQRKLEELSRKTRNKIILKYYRIWRQFTMKKRRQRNALDVTPVWLQNRSVEDCAKSLYRKDQHIVIKNMRRKRLKTNNEEPQLEFLDPIESKIYAGIKENARALDIEIPPNLFWKMIISWPHLDNRPILWRHKKIMNQYLSPSDYTIEPIVKTYKPNPYETLHICIKHFEGLINDHHLTGTDGLFFIATSTEDQKYVVRRLTNTILSRQKLMPIPLIVVVIGENNVAPRKIDINAELETLLDSGYISEYTVHYEDTIDENIILKLIQSATLWLTVNKSPPIPLEMDYLNKIVDACLTEELWLRILGHSSFNAYLKKAVEDVNFVIGLHNEAVTHLIDIVLDPEALTYTDFPPEFKVFLTKNLELPCSYEFFDSTWKREENREELERIMNDLLLPKWTFGWPIDDPMELHKCVVRYCQQALTDSNYNLVSCNVLSNVLLAPTEASKTSFVQVLLEILKEKIRLLESDARVVYNKNHIKHFRTLPWWFKSTTLTNYNETANRLESTNVVTEESMTIDESFIQERENDEILEEIVKQFDNFHEDSNLFDSISKTTRKKISELRDVSQALEKTLAQQKSRSRELEEKLEAALRDSENISIS